MRNISNDRKPRRRSPRPSAPPGHIVYGRQPVWACLKAHKRSPKRLHVLEGAEGLEGLVTLAGDLPIGRHDRGSLDKLARGGVHQGVVLEAEPLPVVEFASWIAQPPEGPAFIVVLDGVEDPHNLGAIVRSAAATGAAAVINPRDRTAPFSPTALKSAAGAMEFIDLVQANNLVRAVNDLQEAGFTVAALDARGERLLWEADLSGRVAIVVGSEGKGIRRLVRQGCDFSLRIPLTGPISSLNASVSAAIALAECLRQRTPVSPE